MLAVTPRFAAAIQNSHTVATLAQIKTGQGVMLIDGLTQKLAVLDGSVTADRAASIRRQCSVALSAGDWVPTGAGDPLSPFTGNEIVLWRGIDYGDGTQELVPLGSFRISQVEIKDSGGDLSIAITGFDRSRTVQRQATTDVVSYPAGTSISTLVQGLIAPRVPPTTLFVYSPTTAVIPAVVQYAPATDVWKEAVALCDSIGFETFFDGWGNNVFQPIPQPANTVPTLILNEGATGTMVGVSRTLDDSSTYNDIIVTGQGTGLAAPVLGQAKDTNLSSPTNVSGGYGDVPQFIQSPLIPDAATALLMAQGLLTTSLGLSEELSVDMVTNPTVDVNDIVSVSRTRLKLANALYVVESMTVPLSSAGMMTLVMRRVR